MRADEGAGVVGHVFPEAEDVDGGLFEHLAEHSDEEVGVGLHHLFDEGGVVVEQGAEVLDADHVAEGAEEAAPAIGEDNEDVVAVFVAAELLAPIEADAGVEVGLHAGGPELAEVLASLHWEAEELRHGAERVPCELAHDDALGIDVGDVVVVLGEDGALEGRVGKEPLVVDDPVVAAEVWSWRDHSRPREPSGQRFPARWARGTRERGRGRADRKSCWRGSAGESSLQCASR